MMPIKSKHMIIRVNDIKDGVSPAIQKLLDITHQKMWSVARTRAIDNLILRPNLFKGRFISSHI